jgi:hypothetical protein
MYVRFSLITGLKLCTRGRFFVLFSPENFPPPKKNGWGKLEFSSEKVLKNRSPKKFRGKLRGKSLSAEKNDRKIGPGCVGKNPESISARKKSSKWFSEKIITMTRVARFFLIQHTKMGKNVPELGKIYQTAIKYAKWPEN